MSISVCSTALLECVQNTPSAWHAGMNGRNQERAAGGPRHTNKLPQGAFGATVNTSPLWGEVVYSVLMLCILAHARG